VRTPIERREVHIENTSFLPLDSLNMGDVCKLAGDGPIYVLCKGGVRAAKACEKLNEEGGCVPLVIEGGILAWEEAGLSVVKEESIMSLERQVRLVVGILVLTGTILGVYVNSNWHLLSGCVGAGLFFAAVTNTCALGMVIAKMPWNQGGKSCCSG
jgi:rhodanese-related sulfurtransferase